MGRLLIPAGAADTVLGLVAGRSADGGGSDSTLFTYPNAGYVGTFFAAS